MFKRILSIIFILIFAVSLFGCGKQPTSKKKESLSDGILSIYTYKPDTFCPIASNNEANLRMLGIIYDGLITLGDNYIPQPALAESWKSDNGNTEWTLNLRNNAFWHSGGACTSGDVVYTVNQIKKTENSPYRHNVSNIEDVVSLDERTIKFTLNKPLAHFVNLLYFPIIKSGADEIELMSYKPDGTGAYKFEDRNEGNIYYLVKNDTWWGGKTKTDTIEIRMLPGGDTALYAFGSGTIDMTPVDNMDWGKFVDPQTAGYTKVATPVYTFLGINHQRPQLAMSELRRAVSMVIDRDEMIDKARMGYGRSAHTPLRPEWYMFEKQKFDHTPSSESAQKLMEESGWKFENNIYKKTEEGVTYTASFSILINEDNIVRENVARIISQKLEPFGINASIERVPYEEYTRRIADGEYDTFVGSMVLSPELDFSGLLGEGNMFSFEDEELQFVMNEMQIKTTKDETRALYEEFINLFEQTNPIVGLFFEDSVMIYSKQISGELLPSYFDIYRGIEGISLITK